MSIDWDEVRERSDRDSLNLAMDPEVELYRLLKRSDMLRATFERDPIRGRTILCAVTKNRVIACEIPDATVVGSKIPPRNQMAAAIGAVRAWCERLGMAVTDSRSSEDGREVVEIEL